jgi:hypothetical protein
MFGNEVYWAVSCTEHEEYGCKCYWDTEGHSHGMFLDNISTIIWKDTITHDRPQSKMESWSAKQDS